ncbi:MAG: CHASE2 domain-containing protein, partial [Nitrospinaceae bacterium]
MQKILELTPNKIGWMATLLVCALFVIKPNALEILELQMIDLRFKTRGPLQPGPEVVLAVVDEKSQDALGRWPWPRSVLAGLVDKLTAYNAFTIAFDIVFSESGDDVYHEAVRMVEQQAQLGKIDPAAAAALREQFLKEKTGDELFADALQRNGNTVLAFFFHDDPRDILHLSSAQIRQGLSAIERFRYKDLDIRAPEGMEYIDRILSRPAVEANLPLFADAAFAAGYFNLVPDADGIMRRYPVIMKGGANYYAPFWLHTVTNYR